MTHPGAVLDVLAIFNEALEQPSPSARAGYLDRVCGGDEAVRGRVETLLAAHDRAGGFLESPAEAMTLDVAPARFSRAPAPSSAPSRRGNRSAKGAWASSTSPSRPSPFAGASP